MSCCSQELFSVLSVQRRINSDLISKCGREGAWTMEDGVFDQVGRRRMEGFQRLYYIKKNCVQ